MEKKLNIGSGTDIKPKIEGWDNLDICPLPGVDIVLDLNSSNWPIADNTYDYIECKMVLEHLNDWLKSIEEIWRIAKPGAKLIVHVPPFASMYAAIDPTHKSFFTYHTFEYLEPGHHFEYYSKAKFNILKRYIRYSWNSFRNFLPALIFNAIPTFYSRYLCFIFPSNSLEFELEVVKPGEKKDG